MSLVESHSSCKVQIMNSAAAWLPKDLDKIVLYVNQLVLFQLLRLHVGKCLTPATPTDSSLP